MHPQPSRTARPAAGPALPHAPAGYLLHLDAKVAGHAGHYLGETDDLARRIGSRRRGRGARLLAAARRLGIGWRLVRTWDAPADKAARLALEHRLKARHGPVLCPACNPAAARNGTLARRLVAAVRWPRPRRYGRPLDGPAPALRPAPGRPGPGPAGGARHPPRALLRLRLIEAERGA